MKKNTAWFTFVELIIVTVIIGIMTLIGFISYIDFISDARDSQRTSDLAKVSSALKIFKQKRWYFSAPWNTQSVVNNGYEVFNQGFLDTDVRLQSLESIPLDPKNNNEYSFSITSNRQEFQIATTLENDETPIAFISWNYSSVSKNVLPSIILAASLDGTTEIHDGVWSGSTNRMLFVFHKQGDNLPYTFETWLPYSEGLDFDELLNIAENNGYFWQNNDYRNCIEIYEDRKYISDFTNTGATEQYQILTSSWTLVNSECNLEDDSYNDSL